MKKVLYALPAMLYCGAVMAFGLRLGFDGSLKPVTWVYMALLLCAAVILCMNRWWGCVPGMAVGFLIIYLFANSRVHHHINETPIGIAVMLYFAITGIICYLTKKTK